jgi:SAM-dependent methyltransferase
MNKFECRVCGERELERQYLTREMMFSTRHEFVYDQCSSCRSLQISDIPNIEALSVYYPGNYYAFSNEEAASRRNNQIRHWLFKERDKAALGHFSPIGSFLKFIKPTLLLEILRATNVTKNHHVLDVGCGDGALLNRLADAGFRNLLGADLFIESNMSTPSGVHILKSTLADVVDTFDLIMFNHSFEHVAAPRDELLAANKKLPIEGRCLVRIPTPSSEAWETYGVEWAQLDAPRHLTLISRLGMTRLAENSGFVVKRVIDDSQGWSLMGSELYRLGLPLSELKAGTHFSRKQIASFKRTALVANAAHRGDSAAFILVKTR